MAREDQRRDADQRDGSEALHRVVGQLADIERLVGGMGRDHRQEGVAIGRRLGHELRADQRIGAGLVLDRERRA